MKIKQLTSNMTELHLNNGTIVLFSYKTPVAAKTLEGHIRTSTHYSVTTSKHINKWIKHHNLIKENFREVDQSLLDDLVK